jgi:hypothetical protein
LILEIVFQVTHLWLMAQGIPDQKWGGKRPGSGRRKLARRSVSARVNPEIYVALVQCAKARKMKLGRLIESILERAVQEVA